MLNVKRSTAIHVSTMTKQHVGDSSCDMAFAKPITDTSNILIKHVTNIRIVIAKHVSNIRISLAHHVLQYNMCHTSNTKIIFTKYVTIVENARPM